LQDLGKKSLALFGLVEGRFMVKTKAGDRNHGHTQQLVRLNKKLQSKILCCVFKLLHAKILSKGQEGYTGIVLY